MSASRPIYRTSFQVAADQAPASDGAQSRRVVVSTERMDRNRRVVKQQWRLDGFRANPVLLANHDQNRFPIGSINVFMGTVAGGPALMGDLSFDTNQRLGAAVADLWDRRVLRAVSAGWTPLVAPEFAYDDEGRVDHIVFPDNELAEVSVVSVPANPDALAVASVLTLERGELATIFDDLTDGLLEAAAGRVAKPPSKPPHVASVKDRRLLLDRALLPRPAYGRNHR